MNVRRKRLGAVISAWSSFLMMFFFFYIIGDLIAGWWHNAIWVWIILGFALISAISTSFRYFAYRESHVPVEHEARHYVDNTQGYIPQQDSSLYAEPTQIEKTQSETYCKFCGSSIELGAEFCANCGASV